MNKVLKDFLKTRINLSQFKKELGDNLYNVKVEKAQIVCSQDLILLINQYLDHKRTLQEVVEWVNVIWFTDLYEYNPLEEDSIASVMSALETLDEEGVQFSKEDFLEMIKCLTNNTEY